jgi:hypothetical protein
MPGQAVTLFRMSLNGSGARRTVTTTIHAMLAPALPGEPAEKALHTFTR